MATKQYATGGQLTKAIDKKFYPTNYNVPMLGFGDFLKDTGLLWGDFMLNQLGAKNLIKDDAYNSNFFKKASKVAEPLGQVAGQIGGNMLLPGIGGQIMGGIQQGVGAVTQDNSGQTEANDAMIDQANKEELLQQYVMAMGGNINPKQLSMGIKVEMEHTNSKNKSKDIAIDHLKENPEYYTILNKAGLIDEFASGGLLNSYAGGGSLQPDNVTLYKEGGSHESNPHFGIQLGNRALVEEGEVRYDSKKYGDYIFSARF